MDLGSWNEPECVPSMSYPASGPEIQALRSASRHRLEALSRTIEREVIPRLLQARRAAVELPAETETAAFDTKLIGWRPGEVDVAELTRLALSRDETAASRFIDGLTERGAPLETICADLLAPSARQLGAMWEDDRVSFTEVTTGVWRLQQILRTLAPAFSPSVGTRASQRSVLLVPAIGEQHSFGIAMVAAHFRKQSWVVHSDNVGSNRELADLVRREWFDLIGISVGTSNRLQELADSISQARSASRNARIGVMVGGPVFLLHPEFVALVGADATAADGSEATANAEQLITFMAHTG